jgi:hypothetical protein
MASAATRLQSAIIEALSDLDDDVAGTIAEDELVTRVGLGSDLQPCLTRRIEPRAESMGRVPDPSHDGVV